jgi:DNA-binding beta-propeller fold protein YncE
VKQDRPTSALADRATPAPLIALAYGLRTGAALALVGFLFVRAVRARLDAAGDFPWAYLLDLSGQLDVFHGLFYSILVVFLFALLLPAHRGRTAGNEIVLGGAVAAGLIAALLLVLPVETTRPEADWPLGFGVLVLWLSINAAVLVWFDFGARDNLRLRRWCRVAVLAADLALPAAVWAFHRRAAGRWVQPLRILPALLLAAAPVAPWLLDPLPPTTPIALPASFQSLASGGFNQVAVSPTDGKIVAVDEDARAVLRFADSADDNPARLALPAAGAFASVGLDWVTGQGVLADVARGHVVVFDLATMQVTRRIPVASPVAVAPENPCHTFWWPETSGLYAFCPEGLLQLCPDGTAVQSHLAYPPGVLVFDSARREMALVTWLRQLLWLAPGRLALAGWEPKPYWTERAAFGSAGRRLLVTSPIDGNVLVFEGDGYTVMPAFPGVRTIAVDRLARLLLGGFSPVLEIRDPESGKLRGRLTAPPWTRAIAVDPGGEFAYIAGRHHGLWRLDLAAAEASLAFRLSRYDPFFPLARLVARRLAGRLGLDVAVAPLPPDQSPQAADLTCSEDSWVDASGLSPALPIH